MHGSIQIVVERELRKSADEIGMTGERGLKLFHDVSDTRGCIDFQLTLTLAKHVFNSRIVLLVMFLVFAEF